MAYTPQNPNGQNVMASSAPVVIASNQSPVPVSGTISVNANGFISTLNSTTVVLGINAIYTGTSEDVTEYADIRVTVFADQPSATDGFQIQQSHNGTNWDLVDSYSLPAVTGRPFSVPAAAKFFRVVYTNGATAQTSFRLQTKLQKTYTKGASVRPQDARSRENDMEEVISYCMHFDGTNWNMQRGTLANGLAIDVTRVQGTVVVTGPAAAPLALDATLVNHTQRFQAATSLTILSAANTAATLSLTAAVGQFHYITRIRISMHNTSAAAVAGSAITLGFTSSNLPGALAWTEGNALAAGTSKIVVDEALENPIKSSVVNTASTIVAPACGAGIVVRITVYYYTAA